MHRRAFLKRSVRSVPVLSDRHGRSIPDAPAIGAGAPFKVSSADLTPYVPRPDKPWDARRAAHFLRRIGFGLTGPQLAAALATTPAALLDAQFNPGPLPENPFYWAESAPPGPEVDPEVRAMSYGPWTRQVQFWWLGMMTNERTMLREKMTLFWHNHFVSELGKVEAPHYMFYQNQLFRAQAFTSFLDLTRSVTIDPAMLIYLDGAENRAGNPNENYARELLELFTLGVGSAQSGKPHYTEQDIIEAARALTGWKVDGLQLTFDPFKFDKGTKTIFGETAHFGVDSGSERNLIDLIFQQVDPDNGRKRAAVFLCTKLYSTFVCSEVHDPEIIAAMAGTLEENNWSVEAVLRELLLSEHFMDEAFYGSQIKSPVEFVAGAIREFGLEIHQNPDPGDAELHDAMTVCANLGQLPLSPPNVKGWLGGRLWITMTSLPMRARYAKLWVEPPPDALAYNFDPIGFAKTIPGFDDVHTFLDGVLGRLVAMEVGASTKATLLDVLLGGGQDYEWKVDEAEQRIRSCLVRIGALGEYNLC